MHRPGVMAPPTLYDEPARPGLMSPDPSAPSLELDLRAILWSIAVVLGALELSFEIVLP